MNNTATTKQQLDSIVSTLELQQATKADYVAPASKIIMAGDGMSVAVEGSKASLYEPNEVFHAGIAEKLGIPFGYYKRMQKENPHLVGANVNGWLEQSKDKFLIRTFETADHKVARAFLSNRYGILDNYDVLFAALQAIRESGIRVEIKEASVTDKRMYIKVIAPDIEVQAEQLLKQYIVPGRHEFTANLGVMSGLCITNSEVGQGQFMVSPLATILKCWNGVIVRDEAFRKQHLGARMDEGFVEWSEQTKQKNFELVVSQTKDAVKTFLSRDYLSGVVEKMTKASMHQLENPVETVEAVTKELGQRVALSSEQRKGILDSFIRGGDTAATAVFNAMTFEAQNWNADDRFETEVFAWDVLPRIAGIDHAQKN